MAATAVPTTSKDFDRAYRAPLTFWGDVRIPKEIKELIETHHPRRSLELGCGLGRFSRYAAQQGVQATGVDFSPVAIARASMRVSQDATPPVFMVSDVTQLSGIDGPFDVSFDVGCFHCLTPEGERGYVAALARLLKPGAVHLMWTLDHSPSDLKITQELVQGVFAPQFTLQQARSNRRRIAASHWFWLERKG